MSTKDTGKSWLMAAACCWMLLFNLVVIRSAAVFYVAILESFHVTREEASWPGNLMAVMANVAAPVPGFLARYVANWKLLMAACAVNALSVSACCFATDVTYVTVFLGAVHGFSIAFMGLCYVTIKTHFDRYRAVASGICNAGIAIGGLIFPPLVQFLFEEYGTRGGFLLCGGAMLNGVAGAVLLRFHPDSPQVLSLARNRKTKFDVALRESGCRAGEGTRSSGCLGTKEDSMTTSLSRELICDEHADETERKTVPGDKPTTNEEARSPAPKKAKTHFLSFLLAPKFYLIAMSMSLVYLNMCTYLTVIMDLAMNQNISKWNAVLLVTQYTASDLVARLVSGVITDRQIWTRNFMMAFGFFAWAVSMSLVPLCYTYSLQVLLSLTSGWSNGAMLILIPILCMDLVDADKFSMCFGMVGCLAGLPLLARPAVLGYYRDNMGDYQGLFLLQGSLTGLGSLLWFSDWIHERCKGRSRRGVVLRAKKSQASSS